MADVQLTSALDMADVAKSLATLPAMTAKEAKKAVAQMDKAFKKAAREANKLAKVQKAAAREAAGAQRDLTEGLKGLAEMAGASGDKFEKLAKVLAGMANPLTSITIGASAGVVAVAGLGAAVVSLVMASGELATKLEPYRELAAFQGVDDAGIDSIMRANDAITSMTIAAEQGVVVLGAEFAPTVAEAATGLLTLELALVDAAAGVEGVGGEVRALLPLFGPLGSLITATGGAFDLAAIGLDDYRESAEEVIVKAKELREAEEGKKEAADKARAAKAAQAQAMREAAQAAREEAQAVKALDGITTSAAQSQLDGADLVLAKRDQQLAKIDEWAEKVTASAEVQQAADEARLEVMRATEDQLAEISAEAMAAEIKDLDDIEKARLKAHDDEMARIKKERDAAVEASQTKLSTAEGVFSALDVLSSAATDAYIEGKGQETEAAKKAAMRQFRLSKALGLAQAVVNTAQAILSSIASLGPPVWPNVLGIAGVASAAIIGAASTVAIASAPPPTFHTGGLIGQAGSTSPDERLVRTLSTESVLNSSATARLGEEGVDALNSGAAATQSQPVVVAVKHRWFNATVEDNMRIAGSPLNRELRRGRRSGRRGK